VTAPERDYSQIRLFDIAANLSDDRYKGVYYGSLLHEPDFDLVIKRAHEYGVRKFLFAAGYIEDAKDSYKLSLKSEDFYCTIGVHPCRAIEPFKDD
jgi:TatD DNase family protein